MKCWNLKLILVQSLPFLRFSRFSITTGSSTTSGSGTGSGTGIDTSGNDSLATGSYFATGSSTTVFLCFSHCFLFFDERFTISFTYSLKEKWKTLTKKFRNRSIWKRNRSPYYPPRPGQPIHSVLKPWYVTSKSNFWNQIENANLKFPIQVFLFFFNSFP